MLQVLDSSVRRFLVVLLFAGRVAAAGYDALSNSAEWLINAYKVVLSPLQGRNMCNFWPTCSQFTKEAIQLHGFIPGLVIGADRLTRCHPAAWTYLDRYYLGISHDRLIDPVSSHLVCQNPRNEPRDISLLALEPEVVATQQGIASSMTVPILGFAEHLYGTQDFARAATEYLRVAFTETVPGLRAYASLMAGESFLRAGDFVQARANFLSCTGLGLSSHAWFGVSRTWFAQGEYDSVRATLSLVTDSSFDIRARTLAGWSLLRQHRFSEAAALFGTAARDSVLTRLVAFDGAGIARRNRLAGTLLSAVIPGAGQLYAGRTSDGIYSLLTVASTGLATWWFATHPEKDLARIKVSLFAAATALFYAANMYGANIAVRDYNRFQERQYLTRAETAIDTLNLIPDYRWLLQMNPNADHKSYGPEREGN